MLRFVFSNEIILQFPFHLPLICHFFNFHSTNNHHSTSPSSVSHHSVSCNNTHSTEYSKATKDTTTTAPLSTQHRSCTRLAREWWARTNPSLTRSCVPTAMSNCDWCSKSTTAWPTRPSKSPSKTKCLETSRKDSSLLVR